MAKLIYILVVAVCVKIVYTQKSACIISFPKSNDQDEPVILTVDEQGSYQFAVPDNGEFLLKANEEVVLLCPNARNTIVNVNKNLVTASCVRNEVLSVLNQQMDFDDIRCSKQVKGDIKATNTRCGNNKGNIINIGFQVTKKDWITLIQVCYDSQQANTLYTEHTIYGQSILRASKQSKRPPFQTNEVPKGLSPNTVYTQASQTKTFTSLLGSEELANTYIRQGVYLARGHLAPDADFLFAPQQFATYFYINTCPQWSNINSGNWKTLELMIRKVAGKHGTEFTVTTGTYDVLELPDINENLVSITLDRNGLLPVPKFIWKVVYSESSKQGIAFVSVNNPYIEKVTNDLILCQDVCSKYSWKSDKWNIPDKGYIYCCDIRELQKSVPGIPKMSISGILRG